MVTEHLSSSERRAQILGEATRVFAQRGFEGTTSAALARSCGVSEALLYKLFQTKKQLFTAMIEHKLASWEPLRVDPETERPLLEILTRLVRQVFERVAADPDFVRLLRYSELQESEFKRTFHEARGRRLVDELSALFAHRAEQGELRADLDPTLSATSFLCSTWHYAAGVKVFGHGDLYPDADDEQVAQFIASLYARGLAA